ncbi:MAG: trigger factor [Planctomycetes bacterium]|nr:trigger factor [Planctomycetota bacterium]
MTDEKIENMEATEQAAEETPAEKHPNLVTVTESGPCKKKIEIEIPEQKVREYLDKKYQDLRKVAEVPGFRKGRAPLRLIEKRFGSDISNQAKLELIIEAAEAAIKDNNLDTLGDPSIDHEKIELPSTGPMKFDFEVEIRPEFDLPDLEGITVSKPKVEVTEQMVDEQLQTLRRQAGVWTPKDKPAELDDQIIADVVLNVEDHNERNKEDNVEIYVRKTAFAAGIPIEDFDQLMKDARHGDTRKTTVELPSTFYNEDYRGKKVNVEIFVKEVKTLEPAEMNEEFLSRYGASDENDLRDMLRDHLESQAERSAQSAMSEQVYAYLRDKVEFDLPETLVASQALSILQRQYSNLLMQGLSREQIDEQMDRLRAASDQQAKEQLKMFFIMDKVADALDVSVSEEEINSHIAYVAAIRGRRPERMREELARDGSLSQFVLQVREQKAIEKILEKANIVEEQPAEGQKAEEATTEGNSDQSGFE